MPHTNNVICATICAYVVFERSVLLVHHDKLNRWLPMGGHIEPGEDPDLALFRELEEETGMLRHEVRAFNQPQPSPVEPGGKTLLVPHYMDRHVIDPACSLDHFALIYFLRARTNRVQLEAGAHREIRWFTEADLDAPKYELSDRVKFYARSAINQANNPS